MPGSNKNKGLKEAFAKFFESPSRESLRQLLIDHTGEHDDLDFKTKMIDASALAKHILAMANKQGGIIIFGVYEKNDKSLEPVGVELDDKTGLYTKINKYIPEDKLGYNVHDFTYSETEYPKIKGMSFRVIIVEYSPEYIPFVSKKEREKDIKKDVIYIRRNSSSEAANYSELQDIFNRRLETGFSSARELSLTEHFKELKEMYSLIPFRKKEVVARLTALQHLQLEQSATAWSNRVDVIENPKYPQEDYDDFLIRMIELKKKVIESLVKSEKYFREN